MAPFDTALQKPGRIRTDLGSEGNRYRQLTVKLWDTDFKGNLSFHLQQNAAHYVPRLERRREVAADLRAVFESMDRVEAERRLRQAVDKYAQKAPKLSSWLEANVA